MRQQSLGFDLVEIDRFALWHKFSDQQLLRVFSKNEIEYCRANAHKSAERFAVRFAAREALYKALMTWKRIIPPIPFLTLCRLVDIVHDQGQPLCHLAWQELHPWYKLTCQPAITLSLTHSRTTAGACVLITCEE
jgi:phosphopantetheine--protein transferase-like protein